MVRHMLVLSLTSACFLRGVARKASLGGLSATDQAICETVDGLMELCAFNATMIVRTQEAVSVGQEQPETEQTQRPSSSRRLPTPLFLDQGSRRGSRIVA